jgi:hypothetical protein
MKTVVYKKSGKKYDCKSDHKNHLRVKNILLKQTFINIPRNVRQQFIITLVMTKMVTNLKFQFRINRIL